MHRPVIDPAASDDAIATLLQFHERLRACLARAREIGEGRTACPEAAREAALRIREDLTDVLPLHARDEEESIFPRVRGRDPEVDAALRATSHEHLDTERPLAVVIAACEEISRVPARLSALAPMLRRACAALDRHFADHLGREERIIYPALRRVLDRAAHRAILDEMCARRGLARAAAASPGGRAA